MKNSCLLALFVFSTFYVNARAANIHFLPGDAFFPTELSAQQLADLRKAEADKFVFEHTAYDQGYFFCGSAGHASAQIETLDQKFVEQLIVGYKLIRKRYSKQLIEVTEEGKTILRESNPIRVLFYPADFDYPKYKLGLQYNENWVEETKKYGYSDDHLVLLTLVDDKAAIIDAWQRSKDVDALKFDLPKVKEDPKTGFNNPIVLKGPIKAIVLPALPLKEFDYGDKQKEVLIVEADGVYQYEEKENEDGLPEMVKVKAK